MRTLWDADAQELLADCEKVDDIFRYRDRTDFISLILLTVGCFDDRSSRHDVLVVADDEDDNGNTNWQAIEELRDNNRSSNNNIVSYQGYIFDPTDAPKPLDDYFVYNYFA